MTNDDSRHRPYSAVYLVLFDQGRVLLSKRQNTGHRDGEYSLVAGHIEDGESATEAMVREANEEIGIEVNQSALTAKHVMHRHSGDRVYLDLYFRADEWSGTVRNREPGKCADLTWVRPDELPPNTVPYVKQAIDRLAGGVFSEFGWESDRRRG